MMALSVYEAGICSCGFHESETSDRANMFQPGVRTCNVCAGGVQFARTLADADERESKALGENPSPMTRRLSDGRHVHMRRLDKLEAEELKDARLGSRRTVA